MKGIPGFFISILLSGCLLTACQKENSAKEAALDVTTEQGSAEILKYLAANNITAQLDPSGLYYRILKDGDGEHFMTLTDTPYVIYTRRLISGIIVESSNGQVTNFDGRQLKDHIPGWQIGLQKISKGGSIELFIPPALGFGSQGISNGGVVIVPPNAVQICEIELVDFR